MRTRLSPNYKCSATEDIANYNKMEKNLWLHIFLTNHQVKQKIPSSFHLPSSWNLPQSTAVNFAFQLTFLPAFAFILLNLKVPCLSAQFFLPVKRTLWIFTFSISIKSIIINNQYSWTFQTQPIPQDKDRTFFHSLLPGRPLATVSLCSTWPLSQLPAVFMDPFH